MLDGRRLPAALGCLLFASTAHAANNLTVLETRLDRPTLVAMGVQMLIGDDDNRDARVTVRYRAQGDADFRDGLPLFRVRPEVVVGRTVPAQFSGAIFNLRPDTSYEIELHAVDPDGFDQTFLSQTSATAHDFQLMNNLYVGPASPLAGKTVDFSAPIDRGLIDYNGYFPDGIFDFNSAGTWQDFAAMQTAGVFEAHGVLLTNATFASGLAAPSSYTTLIDAVDATLAADSSAIDRGITLAGITDGYQGAAPDLGALELAAPLRATGRAQKVRMKAICRAAVSRPRLPTEERPAAAEPAARAQRVQAAAPTPA